MIPRATLGERRIASRGTRLAPGDALGSGTSTAPATGSDSGGVTLARVPAHPVRIRREPSRSSTVLGSVLPGPPPPGSGTPARPAAQLSDESGFGVGAR